MIAPIIIAARAASKRDCVGIPDGTAYSSCFNELAFIDDIPSNDMEIVAFEDFNGSAIVNSGHDRLYDLCTALGTWLPETVSAQRHSRGRISLLSFYRVPREYAARLRRHLGDNCFFRVGEECAVSLAPNEKHFRVQVTLSSLPLLPIEWVDHLLIRARAA